MRFIREIWAEANRPEDFAGQRYKAFKHQFDKAGLAVGALFVTCAVYSNIMGEMPYRMHVAGGLVVAYFVLIELLAQGWRGWDSINDTVFWAWGIVVGVVTFQEVSAEGGRISVAFDGVTGLVALAGLLVHLLFHAATRGRAYTEDT